MVFVKGHQAPYYYNGPRTPIQLVVWIGSITGSLLFVR